MTKVVGPTDNALHFDMNTTEDNLRSGTGSQSMAINATNRTNLSRSTIFDMGFSRGENTTENADSPDSTVNAVTMGLQSMPSIDFNQTHRFTYFSISLDDSESTNSNYAGNMSYHFTDRLDSNISLSAGESTTETPDKSEEVQSLGAGFGLNYRISNKLPGGNRKLQQIRNVRRDPHQPGQGAVQGIDPFELQRPVIMGAPLSQPETRIQQGQDHGRSFRLRHRAGRLGGPQRDRRQPVRHIQHLSRL
jgi:hypothetical protein